MPAMHTLDHFGFYRTPRLIFGPGSSLSIGKTAATFGNMALLVTGGASFHSSKHYPQIISSLKNADITVFEARIAEEPSPTLIDDIVLRYAQHRVSVVIAIGGGSVIDAAKAIAAMLPIQRPISLFLEVVGIEKHPGITLPVIAMPTTSGTGSEASSNAVVTQTGQNGFKRSLRHDNFTPAVALIDPQLSVSCPPFISASCGMDAITQLLESFVSTKATILTDSLARQALALSIAALPQVMKDGTDIHARSDMSYAAFISGVTLANVGLGAVHGLASIIGGMTSVPHGVLCGTLLGPVTEITIKKLRLIDQNHRILHKYAEIGAFCIGADKPLEQRCDALTAVFYRWKKTYGIAELSDYGIDTKRVVQQWNNKDSKNNPVELSSEDISQVIDIK